jgi:3-oxoacyl-[acyl-carrier protein] reductase
MNENADGETCAAEPAPWLAGRVAVVTGAGRGIGRATALELSRAGATVVLVARSRDELEQTAALVGRHGGEALVVPADLGDLDQVAEVAGRVRDELGGASVLVNNAGVVAPLGRFATLDPAAFAAAMTLNVVAVAALTFAALPAMVAGGWGRVANVSTGIVAHPEAMIGGNAYVTSKTALEAHTVNLAAELAGTGVTVNAFRPGAVDTAMQEWIRAQDPGAIGAELHDRFLQMRAEGRLISPETSARSLIARLRGEQTGAIWDVSDQL